MATTRLEAWLVERTPGVPAPFLPHLVPPATDTPPTSTGLFALGTEAILDAVNRPGRDRGAAFSLLAGDALLTYACEAMAEEGGDLAGALETMIRSLGASLL